jgi:hypothetical protein
MHILKQTELEDLEPEKEQSDALLSIPDASHYLDMGIVEDVEMQEDNDDSEAEMRVPDMQVQMVYYIY